MKIIYTLMFLLIHVDCFSNTRAITEEDVFGTRFFPTGQKFIYGGVLNNNCESNDNEPMVWSVFNIKKTEGDHEGVVAPSPHQNEVRVKFNNDHLSVYGSSDIETSSFKWVIESVNKGQKIFVGKTNQNNLYNFLYHEDVPSASFANLKTGELSIDTTIKTTIAMLLQDFLPNPAHQYISFETYQNLSIDIEYAVGIGGLCLVRRELNPYFNPGVYCLKTKPGHSHFFDWTGMSDFTKLASILRNKLLSKCPMSGELTEIFSIEKLNIPPLYSVDGHDYPVIINTQDGIRWKHFFESEKYRSTYKRSDLKKEDEAFKEIYFDFKLKMSHLANKFLELKSKKTLYILANIYAPLTNDILKNVRDALITCRDGDTRFSLLVMTDTPYVKSFENVLVRKAKNIRQEWNGSNSDQWRFVLDQFSFIPNIWD